MTDWRPVTRYEPKPSCARLIHAQGGDFFLARAWRRENEKRETQVFYSFEQTGEFSALAIAMEGGAQ